MERLELSYRCSLAWDALAGDARQRHCGACDTPVLNLSSLTRAEAARAVADAKRERGSVCVRFTRLSDGRVNFAEPAPRGRRSPLLAVIGAAALAVSLALPDAARADATPPPGGADRTGAPTASTAPSAAAKTKTARTPKRPRTRRERERPPEREPELMGLLSEF